MALVGRLPLHIQDRGRRPQGRLAPAHRSRETLAQATAASAPLTSACARSAGHIWAVDVLEPPIH
eukprot:1089923-Pyramimonas_sp.AAC.1